MSISESKFSDIDTYIATFPAEVQVLLNKIRQTIQKAAPEAKETINYQMPTFTLFGNLVHFAAYKNHIGFYPAPDALIEFQEEISAYANSKGAVQFPLNKKIPYTLIRKMVLFRVKQNTEKAKAGKNFKKCKNGHSFYKTSDCPTCPECEKLSKPETGFLSQLSAPARRALESKGITTLKQLSKISESELLDLHGMGPASIPVLKKMLQSEGLSFKDLAKSVKSKLKPDSVQDYLQNVKHPLKDLMNELRKIIASVHPDIEEEIKWNAPAFYYSGKMKPSDPKEYKKYIVVFNLFQQDCIRLIFLFGADIQDTSGILTGTYKDGRRLAEFNSMKDLKEKSEKLKLIIRKCLELKKK